jgi:hypothetical protein
MDAIRNPFIERSEVAREFLRRLWHLENDERPGFLIGDLGGEVTGGKPVLSALFSSEGTDTVRDRLLDPEKFLRAQLEEIEGQMAFRGDLVPALSPALGVVGIPSAFGCEVVWHERDFPSVKPLNMESLKAVHDLPVPGVTDGLLGRVLEYIDYFTRRTGGTFPVRMGDIQGPLDSAALILGHSRFLLALKSHPGEAHAILEKVTDLTIAFAGEMRRRATDRHAEFVPSLFQPWIPDGLGISVSNDECVMISPTLHDQFSLPYLNQISEAFGGIYLHSCGRWTHQLAALRRIRSLRGLEFGASEAPFEPVLEYFGGKTVLACRVGHHRDLKFRGMADFVRRVRRAASTNRGLFIHVDITNGIPGDDWPVSDVGEIYRLLESP